MNSIKRIEVIYDNRLVRFRINKELSPFELPLRSGVFIAKPRPFDGGFGVFDDCLPDG